MAMPLPSGVTLVDDDHLGPVVRVSSEFGATTVHLHGAHVTSWIPAGQEEQLWLSPQSQYGSDSAIRGGVPICFPWFAKGPGDWEPQHGFARRLPWHLDRAQMDPDGVRLELGLTDSDVPDDAPGRDRWPHRFEACYTVHLDNDGLSLDLAVRNTGDVSFDLGGALHTYLHVADISQVRVHGLAGVTSWDKVTGRHDEQREDELVVTGETDRIYDTTDTVAVSDGSGTTLVSGHSTTRTVVWNPWEDKARAMDDFSDDGWQSMLCVEAAIPYDTAIAVTPGERFSFGQRLVDART